MPYTVHGQATAVGVKSHVLYSRLLTDTDYWDLLNLKTTTEISNFLKQTEGYEYDLRVLPHEYVHRVDLENTIKMTVLRQGASFLPYISGAMFKLFMGCLGWYEAEELKSVFRWLRSRRLTREEMKQKLYYMAGSKLPYDDLLNCRNYAEALECLKETKYYNVLREPIRQLMDGETSLFSLELAIDNIPEMEIHKNLNKLPESDKKQLQPIFGTRIDLLNLYHYHRFSLYYHMTIEETLSRMLSIKYKVQTHHLREMSKVKTWKERLDILGKHFPVYAEIFRSALEQPDKELALEMSIARFQYRKSLAVFQSGAPGFHTSVAYFLLKTQEVDDIIRIIENVRYGYSRDSAAAYLVKPILDRGEPAWQ
ncbi:MAG: V-type ATPase subunit [Synergistaceae bacterium]|nr:V-type ATPase subunit [Synergistaceae bacterium]